MQKLKKIKTTSFFKWLRQIYTPWNLFVFTIILVGFVLRSYRLDQILDFHYDQGRDARIIWDLWTKGDLFLIGPVTGLKGIFLGPFYYYLIAPFYLLSSGNPLIPSLFLSFLVALSLYFVYLVGLEMINKYFALTSLLVATFSSYLVFSSRWLSNPTPLFLTSILILYLMVKIVKSQKGSNLYRWTILYFLTGASMHFESASAIFYFPILMVFTVWQIKKINLKTFFVALLFLGITFLPQLVFNFRNDNLIFNNFALEFSQKQSFTSITKLQFSDRLKLFWDMFWVKIFPSSQLLAAVFSIISLLSSTLFFIKNKDKSWLLFLLSIWIILPLLFYSFYRGNHGVLYDYYFTGYYYLYVIFFSLGIWHLTKSIVGKVVFFVFIALFLMQNIIPIYNKLTIGPFNGNDIFISNQLAAIDYIYQDSGGEDFNVDVYVPPVIPHSYDYLFLWYGSKLEHDNNQKEKRLNLLYTLYEVDPPHPERLQAWLDRQAGIGEVVKTVKFGGITVERRQRYEEKR